MKRAFYISVIIISFCMLIKHSQASDSKKQPEFVKGELLIKFKSNISAQSIQGCVNENNLKVTGEYSHINVSLCRITDAKDPLCVCKELNKNSLVEYAEPNFIVHANVLPDDPRLADGDLWGMHNTGQSGGTPDADIDAPGAWDIQTGSHSVIVGVIDSGVDWNHEDLNTNIWSNPGEIPGDGIDNDGNGFIDDIRGWDFVNNDNNPMDDAGHGTHVSGTIGAKGNNGIGVVGVNWNVSIMPLKFLNSSGSGNIADAIGAVLYAGANGANLTNNSWGGGGSSQALKDAIEFYPILFVAAAGNNSADNDTSPHYPSSFDSVNVLSVVSTDRNDLLSSFSNFGLMSVDLGAPGSTILSSLPGDSYSFYNGTSMATPHVAGVGALLLAQDPTLSLQELKAKIVLSTDPIPALDQKTLTGGRLNAHRALTGPFPPIANFTADTRCGTLPFSVNFASHSLAVGPGTTYSWDFGDGGTSTEESPTHTYTVNGPFTVSLAVQDANGSDTTTKSDYITTGGSTYNVLDSNDQDGPAFDWVEISGTGTPLGLGDDDSDFVLLPFTFNYFGTNQSQVFVNSNGNLTFVGPFLGYSNHCLPTSERQDIIAGLWDDLYPPSGGGVYFETRGTAPNRMFIVEWSDVPHYSNVGDATFEIILKEGNNDILFQYLDVDFGDISFDNGVSATVGIQNTPDSCESVSYSCDDAVISDQFAILFSSLLPPVANCNLDLGLSVTGSTLNMDFTVGISTPAIWNVYLRVYGIFIPLWSIPLPAIDPPIAIPVPIPGFPTLGEVGIFTLLATPADGIICFDWKTVDTGP